MDELAAKTRNHYRATLRQWLAFCVNHDYLPDTPRLGEAPGMKNETAGVAVVALMCASLAAWLAEFPNCSEGRIWPYHEITFHDYFRDVAEASQVTWRGNALRHSYISYRLALSGEEHRVAQESGTSPAMIHSNYREPATREEGEAWFAVSPGSSAQHGAWGFLLRPVLADV